MRWLFFLAVAAALLTYFVWEKWGIRQNIPEKLVPMALKEKLDAARPPEEKKEEGNITPPTFEMKNVNPDLKPGGKIYTTEDVEALNRKVHAPSPRKNTFTNADIEKYHRRSLPSDEKVKKEIEWATEPPPAPKRPAKK
jgi:hypothetical protein